MLSKLKLTDIFNRKQPSSANQSFQPIPFDQNYFQLHTQFNGTNLSLISIYATILKGQKSKQKLNLKCKWYIKTTDDFKQIPQITGNFYQPCLDDIGSIISVQIQPFMQDHEYEGITLIKKFGPIKLDSKLEQFQSVILKSKMFNLNLKLESITSNEEKYSELELPIEGTLILNQQCLEFLALSSCLFKYYYKDHEIIVQSIRKTPNSFYLRIQQQFFRLTCQNTLKRDELILALKRYINNSYKFQSQTEPKNDLDHILKIDQLTKINITMKKQLQTMKIQHQHAIKSKSLFQQQSKILKQKLKQYDDIVDCNNKLKMENQKIANQNNYYINQISIYKKLDKQKILIIQKLENEISQLTETLSSKQQQSKKVQLKYDLQMTQLRQQFNIIHQQLKKQKETKTQRQQQFQQKDEIITRLQRKYNTLVSDRSIIDDTKSKKQSQQKQLQIQALKSQIFNLESLLNKHKSEEKETVRIWDIKQLLSGLKNIKNNDGAVVYLQKLVANLTETVTEKQLQLATQKQSNKAINQELIRYRQKYGQIKQEN